MRHQPGPRPPLALAQAPLQWVQALQHKGTVDPQPGDKLWAPTASVTALLQGSSCPWAEGCGEPRLSTPPRPRPTHTRRPTAASNLLLWAGNSRGEGSLVQGSPIPAPCLAARAPESLDCPTPRSHLLCPSTPQGLFSSGSHKEAAAPASSMGTGDRNSTAGGQGPAPTPEPTAA